MYRLRFKNTKGRPDPPSLAWRDDPLFSIGELFIQLLPPPKPKAVDVASFWASGLLRPVLPRVLVAGLAVGWVDVPIRYSAPDNGVDLDVMGKYIIKLLGK